MKLLLSPVLKSYSQTTFKPESQGFCFQMFAVAHFLDFLLLPWFFVPTAEMRGDFVYFLFVSRICFERILCFNINKKEKNNIQFFLISNVNKSKKTKQLLGFFKKKENNANTKTNKKPGRKLRCQKTMVLCWISLRQKRTVNTFSVGLFHFFS